MSLPIQVPPPDEPGTRQVDVVVQEHTSIGRPRVVIRRYETADHSADSSGWRFLRADVYVAGWRVGYYRTLAGAEARAEREIETARTGRRGHFDR